MPAVSGTPWANPSSGPGAEQVSGGGLAPRPAAAPLLRLFTWALELLLRVPGADITAGSTSLI